MVDALGAADGVWRRDLSALDLHFLYEAIAGASLSTCRWCSPGATRRRVDRRCDQKKRCDVNCCRGWQRNEVFSTVGIAQFDHESPGRGAAGDARDADRIRFRIDGLILGDGSRSSAISSSAVP